MFRFFPALELKRELKRETVVVLALFDTYTLNHNRSGLVTFLHTGSETA